MSIKHYSFTLDASEDISELRQLLQRKGAVLHEEPIEELHLPPEVAAQIVADIDAAERGDTEQFKSLEQVKKEVAAFRAKRKANGLG